MKARSVKLKEAHKSSSSGDASFCSIIWDSAGSRLVTASTADPTVLIHDHPHQTSKQPKSLRHHKDGVTSLSLNPHSTCLASGSIDHSVKLQSFPDGEFQTNITRFTLPIRALAFNKTGSLLAAAGDDDGIKLIATVDGSVSRVLKGHKGPITCLAFDPKNDFLASVDAMGTVMYWELASGKSEHVLKNVAPNCISDPFVLNVLCWSPDGETLAVSGLRNDVVMYDRDTSEKLFTLKGEHERSVCFMSWSPNGKYMATSSLDMQVLIWDVDTRQDIERQKFDERICSLAWKPNGNALAVIDVLGRFGVWESPVPTCMKSPTAGATALEEKKTNDLFFDEDDPEPSASGSLDDIREDSCGESAPVSRKRLRKQSLDHDSVDEDMEDDLLHQIESRKRCQKQGRKGNDKVESELSSKIRISNMQESFQPCSTPAQVGKRHFLCYNMLGSITRIENEGNSHIEVDFHDTGRGPRVPSMTDYFGFTMAALSETGSVFANPAKGGKTVSTLMYRPFTSWANNSEWSMRFESEEVKVVALGTGWVAAVTNHNFLRIFSEGGIQRHVFSLGGQVVTAAGNKDELAIVLHSSDCGSSGDQILELKVFNISSATMAISTRLPLTPGSSLSWLGFSEESVISAYDTKGVLRAYKNHFGGCWVPLFSADKVSQSEDESYWVVGLSASKLFCVTCKAPDVYPQVTPKPVLTLLNLSIPLASSDLGSNDLENELMMINLHLSEMQEKIEQLAAAGQDTTAIDDDVFDLEAARDRCILRLIANCCNGDKLIRATELARVLSLEKSIKGAIKLVTALKLPILAEKFSGILEERLLAENAKALPVRPVDSSQASKITVGIGGRFSAPLHLEKNNLALSKNQEKTGRKSNFGERKVEDAKQSVQEKQIPLHPENGGKAKGITLRENKPVSSKDTKTNTEKKTGKDALEVPIKDIKANSEKKTEKNALEIPAKVKNREVAGQQAPRPSNPFAKSSKNQEKLSLLDSLKKMVKTDGEKKDNKSKK